MTGETVTAWFAEAVAAYANEPALRTADGTPAWTWREYGRQAAAVATGLAARGIGRGDVVACWLTNRPEFHAADLGAALLGAASFSIYPTYTADQAAHVLSDAGSTVLITEPAFLDRARQARADPTTSVRTIVCVGAPAPETIGWEELVAQDGDLAALTSGAEPEDLLTIIYTSGTTGPPKGVELTHANVVAQCRAGGEGLDLPDRRSVISYLPMAHIAERLVTHYLPLAHGWRVVTCPEPRAVAGLLPEVRPGVFFSPPRLWEKLRAAVITAHGATPDGPAVLRALGLDQVEVAITGAAPCPAEVIDFWAQLGLAVSEVYGLSETTGVATVNPRDAVRAGTVGTPLPGVEVRLSETGEVLVRGPVIMRGYRNHPGATAEAIDAEGWLRSGDVGVFDEDGYLRIVDRIKEIIVNAAGKNMSPANIEGAVKVAGALIGNVCTIGDGRPYNVALVTLDPAAVGDRDPDDPELRVAVEEQVARANERLARVEQIKRFAVLPGDWVAGGDELTPTSKLKRRVIAEKYRAEIEALYA